MGGAGRHTEQEEPRGRNGSGGHDWECAQDRAAWRRFCSMHVDSSPDGILNEMLMFGGEKMISSMKVLFFTELEEYPQEWCRSLIVPVFKDGDREELDNYRGIALSCKVGKVFERVLDERIRAVSEEMIMKEAHGGFRKGRGCADQIFVLRSVVELRKKQGLKTVIAFLDVKKAYDIVWREANQRVGWMGRVNEVMETERGLPYGSLWA